jgi:hypothetical protein
VICIFHRPLPTQIAGHYINWLILRRWEHSFFALGGKCARAYVDPVTHVGIPIAWTELQLNLPQALTNAGGTIPLVTDPNVGYST